MAAWTEKEIKFVLDLHEKGHSRHDITEEFNEKFDSKRTASSVKHCIETYSDYDVSKEAHIDSLKRLHSTRKAKSKVAKENKAILDKAISQEEFLKEFEDIIKNIKFKIHKPVKSKSKKKTNRTIFACLSDTHYGADIDGEEMGDLNTYGNIEECRRTAFFTNEVAEFKAEHRKDTDLFLALNGDLIQGVLRNLDSTTNLTTQFARAASIISQMVSYLAPKFNKIKIVSVTDNHGRRQHTSDKGRHTKNRFDSYTTMLNVTLKYAFKELKNVDFEVPVTPYWYGKIRGHNYLIMHGDTTLSVGSVGKSLNIETIKNKINDLSSGIGPIDVVVLGHLHIPVKTLLSNGTTLLVNGSLSGIDEFCLALGIVRNSASQKIFEITDKHSVGDMRDVDVLEADNIKELDKIIEPFSGKF